ncbi:3-keto-disaccharide hydrolase [Polaribacter sp.]|uniref:3-keto-disaccharide hydrolase n=1 Tax=Polaribacter sp. TaxID=1920175 RepID=UPI003EF2DCD7
MKEFKSSCFFLLLLMLAGSIRAQNLVKNYSFEQENSVWKSEGDLMERHHHSILGVTPVTGEYYAELANNKGYKLFQEFEVEKGAFYEVSFYARARPRVTDQESYFVFKVDENLEAKIQPDLGKWNRYVYTVEAYNSKMMISFEDTYFGKEGIGAMVDDVEVKKLKPVFSQIFNAKNLAGWKLYAETKDLEKDYFKVVDGAIVCNTIGDKDHGFLWLFYEEELADFELKLKIQAHKDSPGNSGIQVRSKYGLDDDVDGPQIDIHPPRSDRSGLLYDETDGYDHWLYPKTSGMGLSPEVANNKSTFYYADDEPSWNELHIICKGTHIKTILNGTIVTDFNGQGILNDAIHIKQQVGMSGKIALQVHARHEILIAFKDIQLKKL